MNRILIALSCITLSAAAGSGQTLPNVPSFEAVSVKPARAGESMPPIAPAAAKMLMEQANFRGGPGSQDPGRIHYSGVTLQMLLARAYNVRPEQISGPKWFDAEKYDVVATLPPGTNAEELRLMLQNLLTERFLIRLHREEKILSVYRLTIAKGGPKLKPPETPVAYKDDHERTDSLRANAIAGLATVELQHTQGLHLANATIGQFANRLSTRLDRPVEDGTQLEGSYAFTLNWSWNASGSPSIFTAIEEQLGLRLQSEKEPIEILAIDSAEKSPVSD